MLITLGHPRDLKELVLLQKSAETKKKEAEILFIDDQGFGYKDLLIDHHFRIHHVFDIEDIRAVSEYHVVACDIKGVGKRFKSKYEGAHIIHEIHKQYPDKILIGFSTYSFDASFNQYLRLCDNVVQKDIDSDQWIAVLEEATREAVDPIFQWKRMRDFLLGEDVGLLTVLQLQEDYINALMGQNRERFARSRVLEGLPSDLRGVLQGFAANLLFRVLIG
jgi:hypothetical protein